MKEVEFIFATNGHTSDQQVHHVISIMKKESRHTTQGMIKNEYSQLIRWEEK